MLTVVCRAWFPGSGTTHDLPKVQEVSLRMTIPMVILAVGILLTGLLAQTVWQAAASIAAGL